MSSSSSAAVTRSRAARGGGSNSRGAATVDELVGVAAGQSKKTATTKAQHAAEATDVLATSTVTKLRAELQKEIAETSWMYENS